MYMFIGVCQCTVCRLLDACQCGHCKVLFTILHLCIVHSLASLVTASTTAGDALLVTSTTAHAVILYRAPGTAGLILILLPLYPAFTYSPIIGTPKRNTS